MKYFRLLKAHNYQMGDRVIDLTTGIKGYVSNPCGGNGGMLTVLWDNCGERCPASIYEISKIIK